MIRKGDRLYPYVGCCIDCLNNATEIVYDGRLITVETGIILPQVLIDGIATDECILNLFRKEPNLNTATGQLTIRDFKINKGDKIYLINATGGIGVRDEAHNGNCLENGEEVVLTGVNVRLGELHYNNNMASWYMNRFSDRPNGMPLTKEDINLESFGIETKETKIANSSQLIIID